MLLGRRAVLHATAVTRAMGAPFRRSFSGVDPTQEDPQPWAPVGRQQMNDMYSPSGTFEEDIVQGQHSPVTATCDALTKSIMKSINVLDAAQRNEFTGQLKAIESRFLSDLGRLNWSTMVAAKNAPAGSDPAEGAAESDVPSDFKPTLGLSQSASFDNFVQDTVDQGWAPPGRQGHIQGLTSMSGTWDSSELNAPEKQAGSDEEAK